MAPTPISKRLRPTARAWGLVVVGVILLIAAYLLGRAELLVLGAFLVLLPTGTYLLRLAFRPRIVVDRTIFPRTIAVGDRVRVVCEVRNSSVIALEPVSYVDLTPGAARRSVAGVLPSIASRWHRNERKRLRRIAYGIDSMRRGVHEFGPLYFDNADGLGLTRRVMRVGDPEEVEVWPRVHDVSALELPATRAGGEVETGIASSGDADDVLTRDYRRGDALRRVHWRATARAGDLRVRQEEHHAEVTSLVVLDTSASPVDEAERAPATIFDVMDAASPSAGAKVDAAFEQAVSVAASVTAHLHGLGYEVELFETHEDEHGETGQRVSAGDTLGPVMRRLMRTEPDGHPSVGERAESMGELVARAQRLGRVPLVAVCRGLAGDALASLQSLGFHGSPAIAVLVTDRAPSARVRAGFAEYGWQVVTMRASAPDPWRTARTEARA